MSNTIDNIFSHCLGLLIPSMSTAWLTGSADGINMPFILHFILDLVIFFSFMSTTIAYIYWVVLVCKEGRQTDAHDDIENGSLLYQELNHKLTKFDQVYP